MAVKYLESGELTVIWDFLMGGGDSGRGILIGFGDSDLAGDLFLLDILAGGFLVKCVMEVWAFGGETKLCFLYMPGFELLQLTRDSLDCQSWFELFDSPRKFPVQGTSFGYERLYLQIRFCLALVGYFLDRVEFFLVILK
jgi:hypothetical protein